MARLCEKCGKVGLRRIATSRHVKNLWRVKGSDDKKCVEIWALGTKRVDIFFMR
jgi:hypothetical protein